LKQKERGKRENNYVRVARWRGDREKGVKLDKEKKSSKNGCFGNQKD